MDSDRRVWRPALPTLRSTAFLSYRAILTGSLTTLAGVLLLLRSLPDEVARRVYAPERYHSQVRRKPSSKFTRGLYPSFWRAREMSAWESRISPGRGST